MVGSTTVNVAHNPDVTVVSSHTGNFKQGDVGDTYTITVSNVGDLPTNAAVTVTDSLPFAFTAKAISAPGWSCLPFPGLSFTRSDPPPAAPPPNPTYPPTTLTAA